MLALHCELAPLPRSSWNDEITSALETVGLTDRAGDRVSTFSKGMQQRLGLAAALLGEPELVFLDEPTSALDPVGRHDVREIIRGLAARGTAVFLNSHLLSEVEQVCDRVAVVDHGRVIASGTMDELLSGTAVKVRVMGLGEVDKSSLASFGNIDDEGDQLTLPTSSPTACPSWWPRSSDWAARCSRFRRGTRPWKTASFNCSKRKTSNAADPGDRAADRPGDVA